MYGTIPARPIINPAPAPNQAVFEESDSGEDEDLLSEVDAIGDDYIESEEEDSDEEDLRNTLHWVPFPIEGAEGPNRRNNRGDHANNINENDGTLPRFNGYHGRGQFSGVNKAAMNDANCGRSPLKHLHLFLTDDILQQWVNSTNAYAHLFYANKWSKDTNLSEFKAFIAIIFELGVTKFPNRDIAWENSDHGSKFIQKLMSMQRFNQLIRCWRYEDYSQSTPEERVRLKRTRPFWGIHSFATLIADAFKRMYHGAQLKRVQTKKGVVKCSK